MQGTSRVAAGCRDDEYRCGRPDGVRAFHLEGGRSRGARMRRWVQPHVVRPMGGFTEVGSGADAMWGPVLNVSWIRGGREGSGGQTRAFQEGGGAGVGALRAR